MPADLKFFSSLLNLEISEFKKLKGGINSSIYKLKSQNKYFVIKFYPNKKKDRGFFQIKYATVIDILDLKIEKKRSRGNNFV